MVRGDSSASDVSLQSAPKLGGASSTTSSRSVSRQSSSASVKSSASSTVAPPKIQPPKSTAAAGAAVARQNSQVQNSAEVVSGPPPPMRDSQGDLVSNVKAAPRPGGSQASSKNVSRSNSQQSSRAVSRQNSSASQQAARSGTGSRQLSRQNSNASQQGAASGMPPRSKSQMAASAAAATAGTSVIENEQRVMGGADLSKSKSQRERKIQMGMEWNEEDQEWMFIPRQASYQVNQELDDIILMVKKGEIDVSEDARRPSVIRMDSTASSITSGPRPSMDRRKVHLPDFIAGSGRPMIPFASYGEKWPLDVFSLAHNGIRKELQDCYEIMMYFEINWKEALDDEVRRFFAWWDIFFQFVLHYFEAEEQVLFPWLLEKAFLPDPFLEGPRNDRKYKMARVLKGIANSERTFMKKEMRSELVTSLKYSVDRLSVMILDYFGEQEIILPPIVFKNFTLEDKKQYDKKLVDFFLKCPQSGMDIIMLSRWQLGWENHDSSKRKQRELNERAVQEWRYDNLHHFKWASYALWEKSYFEKQVKTVMYFRDQRAIAQKRLDMEAMAIANSKRGKNVRWNAEVQSMTITPRNVNGSQHGTPVTTPRTQQSFARTKSDDARMPSNLTVVPGGPSSVYAPSRGVSTMTTASGKHQPVKESRIPYQLEPKNQAIFLNMDDALESRKGSTVKSVNSAASSRKSSFKSGASSAASSRRASSVGPSSRAASSHWSEFEFEDAY
ncbi:hypothetical protein FVE85_1323 [Porphyridium purpureum]|uniref:Uncharacterized protein n=1 Tax=Porphyridium purpureum TaxID=35688 RepID=A0A5J4YHC6_PORPP|nr:hypothetical protein FVE85_1323 [Porphyridium purpureum]|eukprot:POR0540..scf251_18